METGNKFVELLLEALPLLSNLKDFNLLNAGMDAGRYPNRHYPGLPDRRDLSINYGIVRDVDLESQRQASILRTIKHIGSLEKFRALDIDWLVFDERPSQMISLSDFAHLKHLSISFICKDSGHEGEDNVHIGNPMTPEREAVLGRLLRQASKLEVISLDF